MDNNNYPENFQNNNFNSFFNLSDQLFCIVSEEGRFIQANSSFCKKFGIQLNTDNESDFYDIVRFDFKSKLKSQISELLSSENNSVTFVNSCKVLNGLTEWMEWNFTIDRSQDKPIIYATARDISSKVDFENNLQIVENNYKDFIFNIIGIHLVCDKSLIILNVNESASDVLGYSSNSIKGKNFSYFIFVEDKLSFSEFISNVRFNQPVFKTLRLIDNKSDIHYIDLKITKFYINSNETKFIISGVDVTEKKSLDIKLQKFIYNNELSSFKEEFLSNISNELISPMNVIMGFNDLLLNSNPHDQQLESINSISKASNKLLNVINDIIDFTAVRSDELRVKNTRFSLFNVLNRVHNVTQAHAMRSDLKYNFSYPENISDFVFGDNVRFSQILLNLIGTAINLTSRGEVSVNVLSKSMNKDLSDIAISIAYSVLSSSNNYVGSEIQHDDNQNAEYFGLTNTRLLVKLLGGTLSFDNKKPGLNIINLNIHFRNAYCNPVIEDDEIVKNLKGVSILLVEDSILNQKLAKKLLQSLNADITVAENGQIALNLLASNTFDVILLDLQMPVMNGFTTIRNIRDVMNISTPVIAVTGLTQYDEKQKCLNAGMNDYLSKPFKKEDLFRKLYKYLGK